MSVLLLQLRADLRVFLREPSDLFFSAILPLLFLVLFTAIFGNEEVEGRPDLRVAQQMVPGFIALAIVTAGFTSLTITLVFRRERGVLKRIRITPVAPWVPVAGLIAKALVVGFAVTLVLIVVGRLAYDVSLPAAHLPAVLLAIVVGAITFSCLGIAFARVTRTEDAASAMTNAVALPLFFISGVFLPKEELPDTLRSIGDVLPVGPLHSVLVTAFDPRVSGAGIDLGPLALLAAWGVAGLVVAMLVFNPLPRRDRE